MPRSRGILEMIETLAALLPRGRPLTTEVQRRASRWWSSSRARTGMSRSSPPRPPSSGSSARRCMRCKTACTRSPPEMLTPARPPAPAASREQTTGTTALFCECLPIGRYQTSIGTIRNWFSGERITSRRCHAEHIRICGRDAQENTLAPIRSLIATTEINLKWTSRRGNPTYTGTNVLET